jgi:hypothetical protein
VESQAETVPGVRQMVLASRLMARSVLRVRGRTTKAGRTGPAWGQDQPRHDDVRGGDVVGHDAEEA